MFSLNGRGILLNQLFPLNCLGGVFRREVNQNPPPTIVAKRINVLNLKDFFSNLIESSTRRTVKANLGKNPLNSVQ